MTKPVTLSDDAYNALLGIKGKDMSFSEVILELVESSRQKRHFKKLAGTLRSKSSEMEELKKSIREDRMSNIEDM